MKAAFQIDARDNVATLLAEAEGEVEIIGPAGGRVILPRTIAAGHKVALAAIAAGEPVVKYGTRIGTAVHAIAPGEWVHLHNLRSDFDERSGSFDVETGVPDDTDSAYV